MRHSPKALRAIGYWCDPTHARMRTIHGAEDAYVSFLRQLHEEEVGSGRPFLPDPERVLARLGPTTHDGRVVRYLEQGHVWRACCGYSVCRCCALTGARMGSHDLTDGEWVWPEGLSHYVRAHALPLPRRFVTHVMTGRGIAVAEDVALGPAGEDAPYDYSYWNAWATAVYRGGPEP